MDADAPSSLRIRVLGLPGGKDANASRPCGSTGCPQVHDQLSPGIGVSHRDTRVWGPGGGPAVELTLSARTAYRWQVCTGVDRCRMSMTASILLVPSWASGAS